MPKSATSTPSNATRARERAAEPVVAQEDVADPGHEHAAAARPPRARRRSGARARRGRAPGRRRPARRRARAPPCRSRRRRRPRSCPPARGRRRRRPRAGAASPAFQPVARQRPQLLLGQGLGALQDLPRARVARISSFSSSVSARMFSASSPSISPPSKRSPGDSGRDPRMVLEDDRRGEHRVVADEHRPACRRSRNPEPRSPTRSARRQQRVRRAQRVPQRVLARLARSTASCCGSSRSAAARRPRRRRSRPRRRTRTAPRPTARSTPSCRKRTVTSTSCGSLSNSTCVRISAASSGMQRAPRGREDAAERPAALVLQRRRRVRPQHVALVHHRVGERAQVAHRPSASSASSQVASALRDLYAESRSKLSLLSRTHAVPRK